jgi:hypothetical protein
MHHDGYHRFLPQYCCIRLYIWYCILYFWVYKRGKGTPGMFDPVLLCLMSQSQGLTCWECLIESPQAYSYAHLGKRSNTSMRTNCSHSSIMRAIRILIYLLWEFGNSYRSTREIRVNSHLSYDDSYFSCYKSSHKRI